jgi:hypothetical protein
MPNTLVTPSLLVDQSLLVLADLIDALPEDSRLFFVQELSSLNKSLADVLVDHGMIHPDTPEAR